LLLDLHKSRLQQREATLDSGRAEHIRPAFAAFDTRIDHKLIAAATLRTATHKQQILQAISKVLQSASEAARDSTRAGAFQQS